MPFMAKSDLVSVTTNAGQYLEITDVISGWLSRQNVGDGLLSLFIRHTSASLAVQENADPDVMHDLSGALDRLAPQGPHYRHCNEGADDMPAHIKAVITPVSLSIPVKDGRLMLGTWQGIFVLEHRSRAHRREIALNLTGESRA